MNSDPKLIHPDPFLSANLYYAGRIDEVGHQVLAPFARRLREEDGAGELLFWAMRYGRRGEHWKVRVHGPEGNEERVWQWLQEAWEQGMAAIEPPGETPEPKDGWLAGPAIDIEDRPKTLHEDRQLVRTEYQRHPAALGAEPLPEHDAYVALCVRCLAASTEIALEQLEPNEDGAFTYQKRQSIYLGLVLRAVAASGFRGLELADYLAYHRDTVLRYLVAYSEVDPLEKSREVLGRFRRQVAGLGPAVGQVAESLQSKLDGPGLDDQDDPWARSITDLFAYLGPLSREPELRHLDPFIESSLATVLFKLCHLAANQLAFTKLNEAFIYHLVLAALGSPLCERESLALYPEQVVSAADAEAEGADSLADPSKVAIEG